MKMRNKVLVGIIMAALWATGMYLFDIDLKVEV
jgi:hypothetical protein